MTKEHTPEEIKYRLSNIGEAIGGIALEYIAELEAQIKKMQDDIDCLTFACENYREEMEKNLADATELEQENAELKLKLKTAYRKGMRHMAKALKDYDRTDGVWTDYFEHTVDKVLQREQLDFEEYGTLADQLTKAKKIIQRLVTKLYKYTRFTDDVLAEAEQFLNSEVEK